MKTNIKSRVVFSVMLIASLALGYSSYVSHAFDDTQSHWAKEYIEALQEKNIVQGRTSNIFAPEDYVNRAEFIKMLIIALYQEPTDNNRVVFEDVPASAWFARYVDYAKTTGLISGYEGGRFFRPEQNVTRAEAVKMIIAALGFDGLAETQSQFTDVTEAWQIPYIEKAKELDIVGGYTDTLFGPQDLLTRAQAAKLIFNAIEASSETFIETEEDILAPEEITDDRYNFRGVFDEGKIVLNWNLDHNPNQRTLLIISSVNPVIQYPADIADLVQILSEGTTSYIDENITLLPDTYYYRICNFVDGICEDYSKILAIDVRGGEGAEIPEYEEETGIDKYDPTDTSPYANLVDDSIDISYIFEAGELGKGNVVLNWVLPEDNTKRVLVIKSLTDNDPGYPTAQSETFSILSPDKRTYTDENLSIIPSTYYYRICLFDEGTCVSYSRVVTVDIQGGKPTAEPEEAPPQPEEEEEVGPEVVDPAAYSYGQCFAASNSGPVKDPVLKMSLEGGGDDSWFSSPAVLDLENDGAKEIVAVRDSVIYVWSSDGTLLWKTAWGYNEDSSPLKRSGRIFGSPVVGDLDNDGRMEIAVGSEFGKVTVYNDNGKMRAGWPVSTTSNQTGEVRTLTAADLNRNGEMEIIGALADAGPMLYVWDIDGDKTVAWPQCNAARCNDGNAFNQNISVSDMNNDGELEIYVGFDDMHVGAWNPDGTQVRASSTYALISNISQVKNFHNYNFAKQGSADITQSRSLFGDSAPVMADIDNDGKKEMVVTGEHQSGVSSDIKGNSLFVFEADMLRPAFWETPFETANGLDTVYSDHPNDEIMRTMPTPSVGDINGDNKLDILFPSYNGHLYAIDNKQQVLWRFDFGNDEQIFASEALIADVNRDGSPEIIFTTYGTSTGEGDIYILDKHGQEMARFGLPTRGSMATPTLENLDADPELELVVSLKDNISSFVSGVQVYDLPGSAENCVLWKTGRGNYLRTGSLD